MRGAASLLAVAVVIPCALVAQVTPKPDAPFVEAVVDEVPLRLSCPPPQYPRMMQQANIEGSVLLQLVVETDGHVEPENVEVLESTHEAFETPAVEMVSGCEFRPGRVSGRSVRVLVQMPIEFNLRGRTELSAAAWDTLTLRSVLPEAGDISPSARMASEGPSDDSMTGFSDALPVASWGRSFGGPGLTFVVGSTELAQLDVSVTSMPTSRDAQQPLDYLEMFDLGQLMGMVLGLDGDSAVRVVGRDSVALLGDRMAAWIIEIRAGITNTDVYLAVFVRGRVAAQVVAVAGPGALVAKDLYHVLRFVDERISAEPGFLEDLHAAVAGADADTAYMPDATLLERSGGIDLAAILPGASDVTGARMTADRMKDGEVVGWERTFEPQGSTMMIGESQVVSLSAEANLYDSVVDGLREIAIVEAATGDPETALFEMMGDMDASGREIFQTLDVALEPIDVATLGIAAHGLTMRFRGVMDLDLAAVGYVEGRLGVNFFAVAAKDQLKVDDLLELGRRTHERVRALAPGELGHRVDADLMRRLRRAATLRFVASRLAEEHSALAAWDTVQAMRAFDAGMELDGRSYNLICWYGSLDGHAEHVLPACDGAMEEDSTNVSWRDSRGLARALTGDTDGAIVDFQYYVDNSFNIDTEQRSSWIDQLRAGEDPFTAEVLKSLREPQRNR